MEIKQLPLPDGLRKDVPELTNKAFVTTAKVLPNGHIRFESVKRPPEGKKQ
jgi:hypothetical protein